jgi:hypothetical protein
MFGVAWHLPFTSKTAVTIEAAVTALRTERISIADWFFKFGTAVTTEVAQF